MPKKSGLINDGERGICARVKSFREKIMWPQAAFSAEIGISQNKLASIEYGRTPLRFVVGRTICRIFDVNGEWLATGKGEFSGASIGLASSKYDADYYGRRLFSQVYHDAPMAFWTFSPSLTLGPVEATPDFDPAAFLAGKVKAWFGSSKFESRLLMEQFARVVSDFAENVLLEHRRAGLARRIRFKKDDLAHGSDSELTNSSLKRKELGVRSEIQKLIEQVKRKASKPGAKSNLARELGVAPARISEWLSGEKEPGGDYALRLKRWVELQERQK